MLEKVRYTTHYPRIEGEEVENRDSVALKTFFLTKSVDWIYEKEWRYITPYLACEHGDVSIAEYVDVTSSVRVKEVYLGVKFDSLKMLREIDIISTEQEKGGALVNSFFNLLENGSNEKLDELIGISLRTEDVERK